MSLAIALQQIQKPSWWTFEVKKYRGGFRPLPQVVERRKKIVAYLEANTGRVTTDDLMIRTGDTRSQVQKTMGDLFNEGLVEKGAVKIGMNKHSTWRWVKPNAELRGEE